MCSIVAIFGHGADSAARRELAMAMSRRIRHRGPDWSGVFVDDHAVIAHERLAIVDVHSGSQPLLSPDEQQVLGVNGEIYNHRALRRSLRQPYAFRSQSDCEVILPLYRERGAQLVHELSGMYAFALWDRTTGTYVIARDPIGIIPLYVGRDDDGVLYVASEMKALVGVCTSVELFPPGHVATGRIGDTFTPVRFYERAWMDFATVETSQDHGAEVRGALESAVTSHLMGDVPYGVLLSGGLDSSIVAALAARHAAMRVDDDEKVQAWWPRLHSFAIGLDGSPDLAVAARVAEFLGTVHHGFTYTFEEGLDAISDVIYHVETYDVTSIRASTPMFLLARRIRSMGIKMVLSGEGSDELFGGYLYFHKAPNAREFHEETVRKVMGLHQYDCARANKSMAAWGVEARVPFLDRDFIDVAMSMQPADKMIPRGGIEKAVLRQVFADLLPDEVVKRQKEQFSDGVGYGWIDGLKAHAAARVSDADLANAADRFPWNTPSTYEAYWYRSIFESHFGSLSGANRTVPGGPSVACSTPTAILWDAAFAAMNDPSGRAVNVHADAYAGDGAGKP
jgi:asparagine synthase (glutamine-hydrolysing)